MFQDQKNKNVINRNYSIFLLLDIEFISLVKQDIIILYYIFLSLTLMKLSWAWIEAKGMILFTGSVSGTSNI